MSSQPPTMTTNTTNDTSTTPSAGKEQTKGTRNNGRYRRKRSSRATQKRDKSLADSETGSGIDAQFTASTEDDPQTEKIEQENKASASTGNPKTKGRGRSRWSNKRVGQLDGAPLTVMHDEGEGEKAVSTTEMKEKGKLPQDNNFVSKRRQRRQGRAVLWAEMRSKSGQSQSKAPTNEDFSEMPPTSPPKTQDNFQKSLFVSANTERTSPSAAANTEENPTSTDPTPHDAIINQPLDDIYNMAPSHRKLLLHGPKITITTPNTPIPNIPKRLAMAISPTLNTYFTTNPTSLTYPLQNPHISPKAIHSLLITWAPTACLDPWIPTTVSPTTLAADVRILRASYALKMNVHTSHIMPYWLRYVKREMPTYEEMAVVMENRASERDQLWVCMVRNLWWRREMGEIGDLEVFEGFLRENEGLERALERVAALRRDKELRDLKE